MTLIDEALGGRPLLWPPWAPGRRSLRRLVRQTPWRASPRFGGQKAPISAKVAQRPASAACFGHDLARHRPSPFDTAQSTDGPATRALPDRCSRPTRATHHEHLSRRLPHDWARPTSTPRRVASAQVTYVEGLSVGSAGKAKKAVLKAFDGRARRRPARSRSRCRIRFCVGPLSRRVPRAWSVTRSIILFAKRGRDQIALFRSISFDPGARGRHGPRTRFLRVDPHARRASVIVKRQRDPRPCRQRPSARSSIRPVAGDLYASGFLVGFTRGPAARRMRAPWAAIAASRDHLPMSARDPRGRRSGT